MRTLCSEPGCPNIRPCELHPPRGGWAAWKRANPAAADAYRGDWPVIRKRVLAEEPRCRLCGASASDVDHIQPVSRGGTHERSNLRSLCGPCHRRRTARQTHRGGGGSPQGRLT
jgi:5-methylcytosine-specific restriction protein A